MPNFSMAYTICTYFCWPFVNMRITDGAVKSNDNPVILVILSLIVDQARRTQSK